MAAESQAESRKWRIESVGENFKVVFMHGDQAYELGLFSTREEGTRVADVLTSESACVLYLSYLSYQGCWITELMAATFRAVELKRV